MALDAYEYVLRKTTDTHVPFSALVELTHACNVDCEHCYLDLVPDAKIGALSTDEWKRVFRELRAAGTLFLTMSGGEALVRRDFFELAAYARELGMAITIFSNGILIDDANADRIAALRPLGVEISLLGGIAATHDAIMRRRGAFEKTVAGIRRIRERGIPVLVKCVILDKNAGEVALVREIAERYGCKLKFDIEIAPKDNGSLAPQGLRPEEERRIAAEQAIHAFEEATDGPVVPAARETRVNNKPCGAGRRTCQIGPTGDLFPCTQWTKPVGNLRQSSFAELWNGSETLAQVRKTKIGDFGDCARCELLDICGPCMALSVLERGVIDGPSPTKCASAELRAKSRGLPGRSAWFLRIAAEAAEDGDRRGSETRQRVRLPLVG